MTKNKLHLGVALATLTMAAALVSPQVAAKQKHKKAAAQTTYATPSKTDLMEAQLRAMQDEIASLRAQVNSTAPVTAVDAQKVQELDARMATVETTSTKLIQKEKRKDNMLYFRGGYALNDQAMAATTNTVGTGSTNYQLADTSTGHRNGWNFGAGIDFGLNNDLFGLMQKTDLLGELDINYVDLGSFTSGLTPTLLGHNTLAGSSASQSMLRISASPKIKFLEGSKLRPWIIPIGFTLNVISPPSQANTITVLKPGMNFGGGVDYNIWKSLYLGADVRYFLAASSLDGTNVNGLTAGGSLGFGF
jgi:opacity protein-like surface antigen